MRVAPFAMAICSTAFGSSGIGDPRRVSTLARPFARAFFLDLRRIDNGVCRPKRSEPVRGRRARLSSPDQPGRKRWRDPFSSSKPEYGILEYEHVGFSLSFNQFSTARVRRSSMSIKSMTINRARIAQAQCVRLLRSGFKWSCPVCTIDPPGRPARISHRSQHASAHWLESAE